MPALAANTALASQNPSAFPDRPNLCMIALAATIRAKQRGVKKGKIVEVVSISPAMDALLTRLQTIFPGRDCHYVFPTQDGNQYTSRGFQTLWHRCVGAAMKLEIITPETRFTFHDLRAYYATKHKHDKGSLPDLHKNPQTTAQVYDRNEEVFRDAL